ncbi:cytochrome c oxidase assembly protein [Alicyclobacillus mengziensis]|uniref:Cytochrome c oxidase assembly protein n=1 Tax=Alicyclobacillus mengziensis TaxID=2931921 RepID=A0A9X7VY00_9BACL|nr:cytochrome c oxidase assembly protein [Alicyclobacillus mengziensis]QSO47113.1 cytochrome c oxidase assembly protein [Alicyclobacillus mengziensis]
MSGVFANAPFTDLWQPKIMVTAAVLQVLYLLLTHGNVAERLYQKRHVTNKRQTLSFIIGCWIMYFSFAGPLDYLSDNYIFSAHMVQHMIEIVIMTPLILKGLPAGFYENLLSVRGLGRVLRIWGHPLVAGAVFNLILAIFHSPYLYNLALENENFHLFEHTVFFVIASFMWAPLIIKLPSVRELTNGQKLLYLLYNYNLMMPIVILLLISNHPWYSFYVHAPRLASWLTPMADMQLGAIIMMVFMAGAYLTYAISAYTKQDESIWYQ